MRVLLVCLITLTMKKKNEAAAARVISWVAKRPATRKSIFSSLPAL